MPEKVLSLWHESTEKSAIREELIDQHDDQIRISSLYSAISTGTELQVASGMVPSTLDETMSVPYMSGSFDLPIKYGYSLVGLTESAELVHVLHPHQNIIYVGRESVFYLPPTSNPRRMTLLSNMETVVNALWDSEPHIAPESMASSRIAICGFGYIGALLAVTLKILYGISVFIIEKDNWRQSKAEAMGFQVGDLQSIGLFDLTFNTSRSEKGLQWCIDQGAKNSTVIEMSWYAGSTVSLRLGENFHYSRIQLVCSQVSSIPKHKKGETVLSRKKFAAQLLQHGEYDQLFANELSFQQSPEFFEELRTRRPLDGLVWTLNYQ